MPHSYQRHYGIEVADNLAIVFCCLILPRTTPALVCANVRPDHKFLHSIEMHGLDLLQAHTIRAVNVRGRKCLSITGQRI